MKTYMSDGRIPRKDGTWYTPYQQDMDDIAYRKSHKMSATAKTVFFLIWFFLLVIFW